MIEYCRKCKSSQKVNERDGKLYCKGCGIELIPQGSHKQQARNRAAEKRGQPMLAQRLDEALFEEKAPELKCDSIQKKTTKGAHKEGQEEYTQMKPQFKFSEKEKPGLSG